MPATAAQIKSFKINALDFIKRIQKDFDEEEANFANASEVVIMIGESFALTLDLKNASCTEVFSDQSFSDENDGKASEYLASLENDFLKFCTEITVVVEGIEKKIEVKNSQKQKRVLSKVEEEIKQIQSERKTQTGLAKIFGILEEKNEIFDAGDGSMMGNIFMKINEADQEPSSLIFTKDEAGFVMLTIDDQTRKVPKALGATFIQGTIKKILSQIGPSNQEVVDLFSYHFERQETAQHPIVSDNIFEENQVTKSNLAKKKFDQRAKTLICGETALLTISLVKKSDGALVIISEQDALDPKNCGLKISLNSSSQQGVALKPDDVKLKQAKTLQSKFESLGIKFVKKYEERSSLPEFTLDYNSFLNCEALNNSGIKRIHDFCTSLQNDGAVRENFAKQVYEIFTNLNKYINALEPQELERIEEIRISQDPNYKKGDGVYKYNKKGGFEGRQNLEPDARYVRVPIKHSQFTVSIDVVTGECTVDPDEREIHLYDAFLRNYNIGIVGALKQTNSFAPLADKEPEKGDFYYHGFPGAYFCQNLLKELERQKVESVAVSSSIPSPHPEQASAAPQQNPDNSILLDAS